MHWTALTPFARCTVPTRARWYRLSLALPGLALGAAPLTIGLLTGGWPATFYGFLMLVAAAGDFLILWILRGVPAGAWVQDHPQRVGCLVVASADAAAPSPVAEEDLPEPPASDDQQLSFIGLLGLVALSAACAAVGFLIALGW
jgi:Protein of unknown function (DUF3267).